MMQQMMDKMCSKDECSLAAMCQATMASACNTTEAAAHDTPEARNAFEEWARTVEDEVLAALTARGPLNLATVASALKISPDSALFLVGKPVREGRSTIASIRATGG